MDILPQVRATFCVVGRDFPEFLNILVIKGVKVIKKLFDSDRVLLLDDDATRRGFLGKSDTVAKLESRVKSGMLRCRRLRRPLNVDKG